MFPFVLPPPRPAAAAAGYIGRDASPAGIRKLKRPRSPSPPCGMERNQNTYFAPGRSRVWVNPERGRRFSEIKPNRRWISIDDARFKSDSQGDNFVMMSYNILGDNNCLYHTDLYPNTPYEIRKWESRKKLIHQEISQRNPDLVCLQEVDRFWDISVHMKSNGYEGIHKGRSGDAKDGCAIFWKKERFNLLEEDSIDFCSFNLRNNVAQLLVFEVEGGGKLVVGNIHVLFNPKRGDIKLGQIRLLLERAEELSRNWGGIPIVLAGDFNSTPNSVIYQFLSSSKIDVSLHDRRYLSGLDISSFDLDYWMRKYRWTNEELRNATGDSNISQITNPLKLLSSYATVNVGNAWTRGPNGEPLATSCHSKFLGTVDYLWYTTGLVCLRVLDTLPINLLRKMGGLPTKEMGSDHLALVAEFKFTESATSANPDMN